MILTHPDSDHIGGAPVIITKFQIDKVFTSNYEKEPSKNSTIAYILFSYVPPFYKYYIVLPVMLQAIFSRSDLDAK